MIVTKKWENGSFVGNTGDFDFIVVELADSEWDSQVAGSSVELDMWGEESVYWSHRDRFLKSDC